MLNRKLAMLIGVLAVIGIGAQVWASIISFPGAFDVSVLTRETYTVTTYVLKDQESGWLSHRGDYSLHTVILRAGTKYKLTLSVPGNADFDLALFDENGNKVGSGTRGRGSSETIYVTPRWTGPFVIAVKSSSGSGSFTLKLFRRI